MSCEGKCGGACCDRCKRFNPKGDTLAEIARRNSDIRFLPYDDDPPTKEINNNSSVVWGPFEPGQWVIIDTLCGIWFRCATTDTVEAEEFGELSTPVAAGQYDFAVKRPRTYIAILAANDAAVGTTYARVWAQP